MICLTFIWNKPKHLRKQLKTFCKFKYFDNFSSCMIQPCTIQHVLVGHLMIEVGSLSCLRRNMPFRVLRQKSLDITVQYCDDFYKAIIVIVKMLLTPLWPIVVNCYHRKCHYKYFGEAGITVAFSNQLGCWDGHGSLIKCVSYITSSCDIFFDFSKAVGLVLVMWVLPFC